MPQDITGARAMLEAVLDDLDRHSVFIGHMRRLTVATIDIDEKVDRLDRKIDALSKRDELKDEKRPAGPYLGVS